MIEVLPVVTKKQQREFVDFPLKLYKDNPYFVPPLYMDEMKMFTPDYTYYDTCKASFFNAYKDGRMVGRISGIIQGASNEIRNEKRVRFTRFDSINDVEVARALFDAVENWGKEQGMDTLVGPLGFSDFEREGLLIEGFDQLSTFEEQYNYDYYPALIEAMGLKKEVDWIEHKIYPMDDEEFAKLEKMSELIMKRHNLHWGTAKNLKEFLKKYADKWFDLCDLSYKDIYGTVPFTDNTRKMMIENFNLIIDMDYVSVIMNEKEECVCFGICFASLAKAIQPSGGHLTPLALIRVLKALKHPKIVDCGLIGVDPRYLNAGVPALILAKFERSFLESGIEYAETNLNLEDNYAINNLWHHFKHEDHKRRRCYVKEIK